MAKSVGDLTVRVDAGTQQAAVVALLERMARGAGVPVSVLQGLAAQIPCHPGGGSGAFDQEAFRAARFAEQQEQEAKKYGIPLELIREWDSYGVPWRSVVRRRDVEAK